MGNPLKVLEEIKELCESIEELDYQNHSRYTGDQALERDKIITEIYGKAINALKGVKHGNNSKEHG